MVKAEVVQSVLSGFVMLSVLVICSGYPDLSHDYRILEAGLDPLYRDYINDHRELTDGMPRVCRKDICYEESTRDFRKGDFHWPEIIAGQQVELRCPFSFVNPVYTTRTCTVDSHGLAIWGEEEDTKICPDPPLAELLRELDDEYDNIHPDNWTLFYEDLLSRVVQVFTLYRDAPVDYTDIDSLTIKLKQVIPTFINTEDILYSDTAQDYLNVMDTLMDEDLRSYFHSAISDNKFGMRFREDLGRLPHLLTTPSKAALSYVMNNLAMYTISMNSSEDRMLNISQGFPLQVNENVTVQSPFVAIKILNRSTSKEFAISSSILGLTLLKYSNIFTSSAIWLEMSIEEMEYENKLFLNDTVKNITLPKLEFISDFVPRGSLILLTSDNDNVDLVKDVQVLYSSHTCDVTDECRGDEPSCVHSMGDIWSGDACEVTDTLITDGFTTCLCQSTGAFAIFVQTSSTSDSEIHDPIYPLLPRIIKGDISLFLGFPYKKELEILGTVLGSLSLSCLVATLASYAIFRRSRKGSPTTILVNLCVALTILSSLLLIVQYLGDIMTRTGCTVCNVLRYYLVFVSLMWNAVEAFNMYLMLLRVFDSRVRRFALKAGVIAWGIPLLMVAVCFGVSKKAFNGHFVITSEERGECAFKCQLNKQMLHYAYLIPLSLIILHNLIIFGFVLKTIVKHGQKLGQNKKRNHMVQLVGAVATLVLLGVPWVFSAFGAIDASANDSLIMVQGIFQVVFVIFVNLQGCFIFAFHCARNAQIRQSWSSAVRSVVSVTNTSTMVTSTNNSAIESVKQKEKATEKTDTIPNVAIIDPELKKNGNGEFDRI